MISIIQNVKYCDFHYIEYKKKLISFKFLSQNINSINWTCVVIIKKKKKQKIFE